MTYFNFKDLTFEPNNRLLFDRLHGELNPHEILLVRGSNGCGKTTLLRMLAALIEPHTGSISWQSKCIFKNRDSFHQQLHYIGHQNAIKPSLTVYENLQLYSALAAIKFDSNHAIHVLKKAGLDHLRDALASHLSAGQLRRLSLARLLFNPQPVWILDEPMTALDLAGQQWLNELILEHLTLSGIAIVATHQQLPLNHPVKTLWIGESSS